MASGRANRAPRVAADAWKTFYASSEGRAAVALLFREFGFYGTPMESDPNVLIRSVGQRDVLSRISQLINLKSPEAPQHDGDQSDLLRNLIGS